MTPSPPPERVWLITGASRGLGRAFTAAALERGDRVIATVRDDAALADLASHHPDTLRRRRLDVRDRAQVHAVVDEAAAEFGRLDVVVNNAGYGLVGVVEELSESEVREHLDTNLLGALWVTQAVVPHLREQRSGHIVQVSTTGAVGTVPALGLYNVGKWGLEAFSEALAAEVASFGVRVTIAELGGFDTDWAGASMQFAEPLSAYDELRAAVFGTTEVPWPKPSAEASDADAAEASTDASPEVAAAALLAHLDRADGPLRLLVGDDAPGQVEAALERRRDDYVLDPRFRWPAAVSG